MSRLKKILSDMISGSATDACASMSRHMLSHPAIAPAWKAWESGDLTEAVSLSSQLADMRETSDEGRHLLALVAHLQGDHSAAVAHHARISSRYRWLALLDEPILWSHVHTGDISGALEFAQQRRLPRSTIIRLKLAQEHPFSIDDSGIIELPFTDDALSPYMPGIEGTFCGQSTVFRLDTGGTFVHLSKAQAKHFGIKTVTCEKTFASLSAGKACYGLADEMALGNVILRKVPVVVHHGALSTQAISSALGIELGPIIGTNLLQQFLTTIDGPGRRIVLSSRFDKTARGGHLAMIEAIPGKSHEAAFTMWLDHYMMVQGSVAGHCTNWFVDSGLVAINDSQGQAAMLVSQNKLHGWGSAAANDPSLFTEVPDPVCVGGVCRNGLTAFVVPEATWRAFGDWGCRRVDAMISWGFLTHFVWTIDFDRYVYTLTEVSGA